LQQGANTAAGVALKKEERHPGFAGMPPGKALSPHIGLGVAKGLLTVKDAWFLFYLHHPLVGRFTTLC